MATKSSKSKKTVIRIAPFRVQARGAGKTFTLDFTGLTKQGSAIVVELEFPDWWITVLSEKIRAKMMSMAAGRALPDKRKRR